MINKYFFHLDYKNQYERNKELARIKRLRQESFMLNPPEDTFKNNLIEDVDKRNNNYISKKIDLTRIDLTTQTKETSKKYNEIKKDFQLSDIIEFIQNGLEVNKISIKTNHNSLKKLKIFNKI